MTCAWNELLRLLPQRVRNQVALHEADAQEIRLRLGQPMELVTGSGVFWGTGNTTQEELNSSINAASSYSPWTAATLAQGYITASGGHRMGVCGEAVVKNDVFAGIRDPRSLCIRVARDFPGVSGGITFSGQAMLILGAPGWGKTTLLRDIARKIAQEQVVAVVDERRELFPQGFETGKRMDILFGCPKRQGIETVLKTMTPDNIVVDEITTPADCEALIAAYGCGVRLIATAHGADMADFRRREIYRPLLQNRIFDTFVILHRDKSFHVEEHCL